MIMWLGASLAVAAGPWAETFDAERRRVLPAGDRTVMAIGTEVVPAAASLCRQIDEEGSRCTVKLLPRRARKDTDAWVASLAPEGFTWVVRPLIGEPRVMVAVFDDRREMIDWYVAHRYLRAVPGVETKRLERQVETLEAEVTRLKQAPPPGPETDAEAHRRLAEAVAAVQRLEPEVAREHLTWIEANAPTSPAGRAAAPVAREVSVIGANQASWVVREWVQGPPAEVHADRLVVFWEPWCEHSRALLPAVAEQAPAWSAAGVSLVTVAALSEGVTRAEVEQQVAELGLTVPVALGAGGMAQHYQVESVPAAVLIRDGVVVWRGHLAHVTAELRAAL